MNRLKLHLYKQQQTILRQDSFLFVLPASAARWWAVSRQVYNLWPNTQYTELLLANKADFTQSAGMIWITQLHYFRPFHLELAAINYTRLDLASTHWFLQQTKNWTVQLSISWTHNTPVIGFYKINPLIHSFIHV